MSDRQQRAAFTINLCDQSQAEFKTSCPRQLNTPKHGLAVQTTPRLTQSVITTVCLKKRLLRLFDTR